MEYNGNAIYEYISANNLFDYFYLVGDKWLLIYGDRTGRPKLLAFVSKVYDIDQHISTEEKNKMNKCRLIAEQLSLPFVIIRYANNSLNVTLYMSETNRIYYLTFDRLRDVFEHYGVVEEGTPKKEVNQYTSSRYHQWQRTNLGRITVTDLDLVKFNYDDIESIIELKRSKKPLNIWNPYTNDFSNFALIINAIVLSGKRIPFYLYYNLLADGVIGNREEDTSKIKVFEFVLPNRIITPNEVHYTHLGFSNLPDLL